MIATKSGCTWKGKAVEDLTREELIEAVIHLGREYQRQVDEHMRQWNLLGRRHAS